MFETYKALPLTIKAVQFTEKTRDRLIKELGGTAAALHENEKPILIVTTIHGDIAIVRLSDWIVQDVGAGAYYPVKDSVFRDRYSLKQNPDTIGESR